MQRLVLYASTAKLSSVKASSDGIVKLRSSLFLKTKCSLDLNYYPFDVQKCGIVFSSWIYDISRLNVSLRNCKASYNDSVFKIITGDHLMELHAVRAVRTLVTDERYGGKTYPFLHFNLYIQRRSTYYIFNFLIPSILINIIGLLASLVPAESGEKTTLGVSTMLSMYVFLVTVSYEIPPSDEIPVINIYFACTMIIITLGTIMSVVSLRITYYGFWGAEVTDRVRYFCCWIINSVNMKDP